MGSPQHGKKSGTTEQNEVKKYSFNNNPTWLRNSVNAEIVLKPSKEII